MDCKIDELESEFFVLKKYANENRMALKQRINSLSVRKEGWKKTYKIGIDDL